ncbi:MAG TPA: isoaspartyl peptidase/L-asparaginase [Chitinophagaceae bacterium]|nr:isoaspartyl peptidase/L-asparaginase [Chitinophagaceae bacterium]
MKKLLIIISVFFLNKVLAQPTPALTDKYVLVIHGGAGTILKSQMTAEKERAYQAALNQALDAGQAILARGGSALDAVEASVRILEDNPLFNAGKGAVFTNEGKNEMDAAIMNGQTLAAGSVAGVTTIRNPISAARAVMEKSPHVMMTGKGAEIFAKQQGLTIVDPSYFRTEERWKSLQKAKAGDSLQKRKKDSILKKTTAFSEFYDSPLGLTGKYGTVGAVALDRHGNLAAATSTGGMTNKKYGRVGDAPIIGSGTYANNQTVAISCTGWGEYFIRLVMAKSISDMMEFGKMSLRDAAHEMIMKRLPALGGDGGLIAVDKDGNIALPFCTEGMYRGFVKSDGSKAVKIYKEYN